MQQRRSMEIPSLPFPALVADIGGTNARFAMIPDTYGDIRQFPAVRTGDYPDVVSAIEDVVLARTSLLPRSLAIAMAGPVVHSGARLTNADWTIDPEALLSELSLDEIVLLNDFEALALALPTLTEGDVFKVGGGEPEPTGARVVLGPGTGLGVAALVHGTIRFVPIAGEGGHMSFAPETEEDFALWPHLPRLHGRITGEAVLSGGGLARIHHALMAKAGRTSELTTGEAVTSAALAGEPEAVRAVELFATYLGRLAGDLALLFLARGGVFIAGGIAPRMLDALAGGQFRAAFEDKAPHAAIVREIPAYVITEERPAVAGLAAYARMPNRYGLSLQGRRLRAGDQ